MAKLSVLGTGGWGIALAMNGKSCGMDVVMWSLFEDEVKALQSSRESRLLSGIKIPEDIEITNDLSRADNADITIIAVPSFAVRETAARLKSFNTGIIVNVAKGFEKGSMKCLSDVIGEELPGRKIVVLSGPSHAEEVARAVPTSVVVSSYDAEAAGYVQKMLMGPKFRIYTNSDVKGVEVGGAIKNVIAVAAGIENGLEVGDNTRAALITRGLAEMARLGVAMGADRNTFMGLSGLGDLIVTCISVHSRNNRFGNLIGKGVPVKEALSQVGTVEGYYATEIVMRLAEKYGVDMPITAECYSVLYNGADPLAALSNLMTRPGRPECETETPWM